MTRLVEEGNKRMNLFEIAIIPTKTKYEKFFLLE